jgi:hypothetical protein
MQYYNTNNKDILMMFNKRKINELSNRGLQINNIKNSVEETLYRILNNSIAVVKSKELNISNQASQGNEIYIFEDGIAISINAYETMERVDGFNNEDAFIILDYVFYEDTDEVCAEKLEYYENNLF